MLKSAVLFTRVELDVHIFADDHLQSEFRNMVRQKLDLLQSLKQFFINVPYYSILIAGLTLMALS